MTQEEFENLLRLWGYAFGPRLAESLAEPTSPTGDSPLARIGQVRTIRTVTTMDRGGHGRRLMLGAAAGLLDRDGEQARAVPAWSVSPVRSAETRTSSSNILSEGREFAPEVMRVERAALSLHRVDATLGRVIRVEYCQLGSQGDKADQFKLKRNAYRERVAEAKGWLRRDLAA